MTQIKKTLGIAGIIAMVGAPAMADIASTAYVQNIVNNMIPQSGTTGQVLRKAVNGRVEWADAPTPVAATVSTAGLTKLYTDVGTNTDGTMTQAAIKTALDTKLENKAIATHGLAIGNGASAGSVEILDENDDVTWISGIAIGNNANVSSNGIVIGNSAEGRAEADDHKGVAIGNNASYVEHSIAIGGNASSTYSSVAIGVGASGDTGSTAIGYSSGASNGGIAIGGNANASQDGSIQLGPGSNNTPYTLSVGIGNNEDYSQSFILLRSNGSIPASRLTGMAQDESGEWFENKGERGQFLRSNGDDTASWVDAPAAPSLGSLMPPQPSDCKVHGRKCALVAIYDEADGSPENGYFYYDWEVIKVNQ